jgi:hypothetical protein
VWYSTDWPGRHTPQWIQDTSCSYDIPRHYEWGGGGISPHILNLGTWMEVNDQLHAPGGDPVTSCVGGWMGSRGSLNAVEKGKHFPRAGNRTVIRLQSSLQFSYSSDWTIPVLSDRVHKSQPLALVLSQMNRLHIFLFILFMNNFIIPPSVRRSSKLSLRGFLPKLCMRFSSPINDIIIIIIIITQVYYLHILYLGGMQ